MADLTFENTSKFLDTPKGKLHYHEAGSGPVLLMLHGSGPGVTGWVNFRGNFPVFAEHFRTIILDMPGYGKSYALSSDPFGETISGVVDFLDGMGIDKFHIIGNSFGGMVGSNLAADYPERVDRFVAIGGVMMPLTFPMPAEGITRLCDFVEEPTRENMIKWLNSMVYDQSIVTEELIEMRFASAMEPVTMATSKKMYSRESSRNLAASFVGPGAAKRLETLTKIKAPTFIAWGRDDRVTPLDGCLVPMRMIENGELHVFPKCGHWAMIEQKDRFESAVLAFLGANG